MITKEELREYREAFEKVSAGSRRQRELEERRHSDISFLLQENAKLRKLAAEMYPCAKAYLQEWRMVGGIDSKSYDWYLRLRELGVEVDA